MDRPALLCFLVLIVFAPASRAAERPNIVLVMADDLGWSDLHCQGNDRLDTPHIDRFAKQGMRFTDAYASAPVCSPTRGAIMTGLSPARLRLTNHISNRKFLPDNATLDPAETLRHLPLEHVTIAEQLRGAGYATAFLGKWHLAGVPGRGGLGIEKFYPQHQGFDLNLGGCAHGGPPSYFDPYNIHNLPNRRAGEYLPDRLVDEAITFMKTKRDRPFFLTLWHYTVHWPMEAPKKLITKYEKRLGPGLKDARYGAMIEAMDVAFGQLMQALEQSGAAENTLVIFTSDNGGFSGVADNRPLRSGKGYLYEGGIRVPLLVRWPSVIKPGTTCRVPVISHDLYPTLQQAGQTMRDTEAIVDGESLLPLWKQTGKLKRSAIHFHYPNYAWHRSNRLGSAIRSGRYKLIEHFDDGSVELYDLQADLSEKNNLARQQPEKAAELRERLQRWRKEMKAALPTKRATR